MHFPSLLLALLASSAHAIPQSNESPPPVSTEYTDDSTFQKAILDATNLYRRQHNASQLSWNESLVAYAQDWSDNCNFEHSGGPLGENLASGYPNVTASVEAWGDERSAYDFEQGEFAAETGHFTQLVWRNTSTVGCARTECNSGQEGGEGDAPGWYVVCEYYPAGNVVDQFTDNVLEQLPDDEVPSADDAPTTTGAPEGAASSVEGNMGALWVALVLALAGSF